MAFVTGLDQLANDQIVSFIAMFAIACVNIINGLLFYVTMMVISVFNYNRAKMEDSDQQNHLALGIMDLDDFKK